jgi:hypothetical protein
MVTYFGIQAYLIDAFTLHAASGAVSATLSSAFPHAYAFFDSSQLLPLLRSCALWLALDFRCLLRQCITRWVTVKATRFSPLRQLL